MKRERERKAIIDESWWSKPYNECILLLFSSLSRLFALCDRVCRGVEYFFGIQIHHSILLVFFFLFSMFFSLSAFSSSTSSLHTFLFFGRFLCVFGSHSKFHFVLLYRRRRRRRLYCKRAKLACIHLIHSSFYVDRFNPHKHTLSIQYIFFFVSCWFFFLHEND